MDCLLASLFVCFHFELSTLSKNIFSTSPFKTFLKLLSPGLSSPLYHMSTSHSDLEPTHSLQSSTVSLISTTSSVLFVLLLPFPKQDTFPWTEFFKSDVLLSEVQINKGKETSLDKFIKKSHFVSWIMAPTLSTPLKLLLLRSIITFSLNLIVMFNCSLIVSLHLFCTVHPILLSMCSARVIKTHYFLHSSTLAWKIPWTEEPGMLQSMGLLRVGHDWVTSLSLFTFMHWRRIWQPTPVFLPGESQGWGSLVGCRLWGRTELDTTEAT